MKLQQNDFFPEMNCNGKIFSETVSETHTRVEDQGRFSIVVQTEA